MCRLTLLKLQVDRFFFSFCVPMALSKAEAALALHPQSYDLYDTCGKAQIFHLKESTPFGDPKKHPELRLEG